jgi:hypothetical protein
MRKLWMTSMFITALLTLLTGCSKSPMEALQSNSLYNGYDEPYWANQRIQKTPLWQEAKSYCLKNSAKPNCATVYAQIFFDGSTTVPKYGSSGSHLEVPNF